MTPKDKLVGLAFFAASVLLLPSLSRSLSLITNGGLPQTATWLVLLAVFTAWQWTMTSLLVGTAYRASKFVTSYFGRRGD